MAFYSSARAPRPEQGDGGATARSSTVSRLLHTGGSPAMNSADGNNSTPVITEIYLAEVNVPFITSPTGISVFNGSDVTNNEKAALYDSNGTLVAATASTAGSGADTYQRLPFATNSANGTFTGVTLEPGLYYIGTMYDGTTSRYNTHAVGSFGAGKVTGAVYATAFNTTALSITPPVTFTTALGPIASLY